MYTNLHILCKINYSSLGLVSFSQTLENNFLEAYQMSRVISNHIHSGGPLDVVFGGLVFSNLSCMLESPGGLCKNTYA